MKKIIFFLSLLVAVSTTNAQTAAKQPAKPKFTSKDSLMCGKQWKVVTIEEWGVVNKPNEKTQNDMLLMNLDGTYNLILFGNKKAGTWSKAGQYIYFTDSATNEKFNYKIISVEKTKLKFDYRDPDETHSIYEMTNN
jgi:hypothetical protein